MKWLIRWALGSGLEWLPLEYMERPVEKVPE